MIAVSWPAPWRDLLLASQNPGKLNEMRLLVEGLPFRVVGPRDLGLLEAPDETGATLPRERHDQGARATRGSPAG